MKNNILHIEFDVKFLICLPKRIYCPECGTLSKRRSKDKVFYRDLNLDKPTVLCVTVGNYYCPKCRRHYRNELPFAVKGSHFTKRVIDTAIKAVDRDNMSFNNIPERLRDDFNVDVSCSSTRRWFNRFGDTLDWGEYEEYVQATCSGVVCFDELYDGKFCVITAVDGITDKVIGYQISDNAKSEELKRFFKYLKDEAGIDIIVAITDGNTRYPASLKAIWPKIKHQLCLFHVIKDVNRDIQDAVRSYRRTLPKAKKLKRGRLPKGKRRTLEKKRHEKEKKKREERFKIWKARHLFTKKDVNLTGEEKITLKELFLRHPTLKRIREFEVEFYEIFEKSKTKEEALKRRDKLSSRKKYLKNKFLTRAIKKLKKEKFKDMITYLEYENLPRTTNSAERENRRIRLDQKTRYRIRTKYGLHNKIKVRAMRRFRDNLSSKKKVELRLRQERQYNVAI